MSQAINTRPSTLYAIRGKFQAWCFDRAVTTFAKALEERVKTVAKASKSEKAAETRALREVEKWLSSADPRPTTVKGRFRDPMAG